MKEGWELKTLKEIGEIQTGTTPPTKDKSNYGNFIPFVKPAHFAKDGSIDTKDSKLSKEGLKKGRLFKSNSILMVCIGATIGKTGFSNVAVSSNQQINALTPSNNYEAKLLYYALISPLFQREIMTIGKSSQATLPIINKSKWGKLQIYLPLDKEEQKQIVNTLDKAFQQLDQAKANLEKNLNNAKELFQSKLNKVFSQKGEGWEEKKLGDIASVEYGFTAKSTEEGRMRYVRITDIDTKGNLIVEAKKYIEDTDEAKKFQLKNNDIVMARTGATFGKVLLYKDYEPSVFASYLIRIHFSENISNELYWYFSKSQFYWSQANNLSSGSAQPHFNGKALKEVIFSYPKSEKRQKELIGEFKSLLDEVEKLQTHYQQRLNNLEELKKSILQKAFKGELH